MRTTRLVRAGTAAVAATIMTVAGPAAPGYAAALSMTLSSTGGPSGGGNTITATVVASAAVPAPFPAGTQPLLQFQYSGVGSTACAANAKDPAAPDGSGTALTAGAVTVNPDDVRRISNTKIAFVVPSDLVLINSQTTAKWFLCAYDDTADLLVASGTYTLAMRPKITSIIPAASPAAGGQTITVNGVGFSSTTTVSIGGTALTGVKVNAGGTSLIATAPARTAGSGLALVATTAGGSVNSLDPDNNGEPQDGDDDTPDAPIPFTYWNGIKVSPNSTAAGSRVSLEIKGVGFNNLTFDVTDAAAPTDPTGHVFLVKDKYAADSNRGVQECRPVLAISSTELVCTLDLSSSLDPTTSADDPDPVEDGTYTVTVVSDGSTDATADEVNASIVSSGSTFTVGPF